MAAFHLAVQLLSQDSPLDRERLTRARAQARAVIAEACQADGRPGTRRGSHPRQHGQAAEAVLFAGVIGDWHRRRTLDPEAVPRVAESRGRHRYEQAAGLLRRNDIADSPLRQSFALSAAVLDGLALSEVIEGAAKLAALLAEVEHPGEPGQRGSSRSRWFAGYAMWKWPRRSRERAAGTALYWSRCRAGSWPGP